MPSGYTISYMNTNNTECFTSSNTLTDIDTSAVSYDIQGLEEGTQYSITVTLSSGDGASDDDTAVYSTEDACKTLKNYVFCATCSNVYALYI